MWKPKLKVPCLANNFQELGQEDEDEEEGYSDQEGYREGQLHQEEDKEEEEEEENTEGEEDDQFVQVQQQHQLQTNDILQSPLAVAIGMSNEYQQKGQIPLEILVKKMEERERKKLRTQKLQSEDRYKSSQTQGGEQGNEQAKKDMPKFKRENKNRPVEVSSKVKPSRIREVPGLSVKHKKTWDPRFDRSADEQAVDKSFRRRFAFVFNEVLPNEINELQQKIKQEEDPDVKWQLKQQLITKKQRLKQHQQKMENEAFETEIKDQQKEAIKAGKNPYFLKKAEKEKMMLKRKFEKLKEEGKLEKVMAKKKKKRARKDQKILEKQQR
eukprot:TRINITY_DN25759_c3_g1_i1.p1 TRINITY_DN25759_c3_g1~~TRINITY_DN25759_c3_g1_i1.p1  ORF type:complete len:326 (-),score=71.43 TRINITY_DN25759_c3_g1_i1:830-1807(-)